MEIYYKNGTGKILDFTKPPYRMLMDTDLFDYQWDYETRGELHPKIARFSRKMIRKDVPVMIQAKSKEAHQKAAGDIIRITEEDIFKNTPGKFYIGDFYLPCYFVESGKTGWRNGVISSRSDFSLISERGMWIRETSYVFRMDAGMLSSIGNQNLDYAYDYPFDYANGMTGRKINNTGITGTDFEITIYGACLNPSVNIGGETYRVYTSLDTGEYMKINSITKKIYKVKVNGETVNQFHLRDREPQTYFRKIKPGINAVTWSGAYGVDITLFEERSEPEWI